MDTNYNLYDGKTFQDLLKDIVFNNETKKEEISTIISELRDKIKNINDAIILAPIIQSYLDISVKNDEMLIKMAAVVQRLICASSENSGDSDFGLSDTDKEQLLKEIKNIDLNIKTPIEITKIEK